MISCAYFGKYTGIVEDNQDTQHLGQLQVSVPAIFGPDEKVLARAALPYGYYFVPEVHAKVWVEFEGGDPGLPIWTGIQFTAAADFAQEAAVSPPQMRVLKTAAGHLLAFADKSGDEHIEIKDGFHGHDIKLDSSGITIKDSGGNQVKLESSGVTVSAASGAQVKLESSGVTVSTSGTVTVTGTQVKLGVGAMPVLRAGVDQGVGNLGAPVPLLSIPAPPQTVLA